jgi:arylsulfatase
MPATRAPNVLWICTDQQRFDTLGAGGNRHASTPVLDRLWRDGCAFTHAFCQSPICTPSRASFLTGTYPSTTQNTRNGNDRWQGRYPLITRLLADAGYECGLIGKQHIAGAYNRVEPRGDDGYSHWRWSHAARDGWPVGHAYADWVRAQGEDLGELIKDPAGVPTALHQTTWCAQKAIAFVESRGADERPWLLSINPYDPHEPFNPPQEYRDQFVPEAMPGPWFRPSDLEQQRRLAAIEFQGEARSPEALDIPHPVLPVYPADPRQPPGDPAAARDAKTLQAAYYAMIKLVDDQVGRILQAVDAAGQTADTLVIFTSDHGEMLGDHGLVRKGCRFYEGLVRVPLILRWPARFPGGRESQELVELTDLAPTLLDAAGLEAPAWMVGRSLLPSAAGRADPSQERQAVRCEYFDALAPQVLRAGHDGHDGSYATMYRDRRYKLVVYHGHGLGELYDLDADPHEFDNRWDDADYGQIKQQLLIASFDASIRAAVDVGSKRIGPM